MEAAIKSWGNSYGIRVPSRELKRLGLTPGQSVRVKIEPLQQEKIDLGEVPTFHMGGLETARRHYAEHAHEAR